MHIRKIAAAASFACGAALACAPLASADASSNTAALADTLISGLSPAATTPINLDISFDGYTLYDGMGTADATTISGQYGFAIAYGDHATAFAGGGIGNYALASGNNALANAGSLTTGATGYNYNIAEDIGNNTNGGPGAPDGAFAGGGSLVAGGTDSGASSSNAAYFFGNGGPNTVGDVTSNGNSGAFAGDSQLIGYMNVAGSGNTAYTAGNLSGENDGSAAVGGTGNFASSSGNETGVNEGAFAAFGNNNQAIADTNYTTSGDGVSATFGNNNYAYVFGPNNSTASAGGDAAHLGNNNIAYVNDPFGATNAADSATAGSSGTTAGSSDLAEVLYTHGDASATGGNNLYDILTPFGPFHSASLPAAVDAAAVDPAAANPAATDPFVSLLDSEIASENQQFELAALFAGVYGDVTKATTPGTFDTILAKDVPVVTDPTKVTPLEYELYGVDPIKAGISGDTGPFSLFNGAETKFDDAYNVFLYAAENKDAVIPASDLFGNHIADALTPVVNGSATVATAAEAFTYFYNFGIGDLSGFFQTDLSAFDITPQAATALFDLFDPSAMLGSM